MQYNITYRQKDKGWQYIISYKDANGDWKQKSKQGFEKKKDAQTAAGSRIEELKKEVALSSNSKPEYRNITLGQFAEELLESEKLHKTANTIISKELALKKFSNIKNIPLTELRNSDIQKCVDSMVSAGMKLSTVKCHLTKLKYILNQAVRPYKIIPATPIEDIKLPLTQYDDGEKGMHVLEQNEITKLLTFMKSKQLYLKYYYVCSFVLGTGLRRGELLGLTWDNVDFRKREIHVVRQWKKLPNSKEGFGTLKRYNSKRIVPISETTANQLMEYKMAYNVVNMDNRVFPFAPDSLPVCIRNISKKVGLNVHLHMLRHTYATALIANGVDFKTAASILGHDVEMTMKVYSHVTDEMMKRAARKINNIF